MNRAKSRRQTLGPVSVNAGPEPSSSGARRRQSVGPSSVPPKARPPTGRASMIPRVGRENHVPHTPSSTKPRPPSSSARRSSVGGDRRQSLGLPPPAAPAKTDPRQISDKAFQQNCIKKLLKYLVNNGYDHPITHKSLARPSGKDFNHIVTFLFRQVDPNFQDGTMKIEDEISMNFKALSYPFTVSKTSLVAAGSPHAWPGLLAALTWLTERIQLLQSVDTNVIQETDNFESLEELEVKTDKVFFRYLSASYTAFLRGDEQATEDLELGLAQQFEKDDAIIEGEIEQMTDKNAVILEQITNLNAGENDLQDYVKKRDGYKTDLAQFHDLIDQMDNHVKMLQQKKIDRSTELEESSSKLEETNARIKNVNEAIKAQELSLDAARNLQITLKGVCEAIERAQASNETRKSTLAEHTSDQHSLWNQVEEIAPMYNEALRELSLVLPDADTLPPKLEVSKGSVSSGNSKLGEGLERELQEYFLSLKERLSSSLSQAKRDYQERLDELAHSDGHLAEASQNVQIIRDKVTAREATLEQEREASDAKCAIRLREAEAMESKVSTLRDPVALEERMAQYERQCTELESLRLQNRESSSVAMNAVLEEIEHATEAMDKFEEFLMSQIRDVQHHRSTLRESRASLRAQSGKDVSSQ